MRIRFNADGYARHFRTHALLAPLAPYMERVVDEGANAFVLNALVVDKSSSQAECKL